MCTPNAAMTAVAPPSAIIPYLILSSVLMADPRNYYEINFSNYMKLLIGISMIHLRISTNIPSFLL